MSYQTTGIAFKCYDTKYGWKVILDLNGLNKFICLYEQTAKPLMNSYVLAKAFAARIHDVRRFTP